MTTAVFMAGCSKTNEIVPNSEATGSGTGQGQGQGQGGNFQMPDLMGEVTAIKDKTITLKLESLPSGANGGFQNGSRPTGSMPSGSNGTPPDNTGSRTGSMQQPQVQYTGKTQDITLTDSVKILSISNSQSGTSQSEVKLSDIKTGETVSVYYASDGKTIDHISVSNGTFGGFGGGNPGGNQSAASK